MPGAQPAVAVLLWKEGTQTVPLQPDYFGFKIPMNSWWAMDWITTRTIAIYPHCSLGSRGSEIEVAQRFLLPLLSLPLAF